MRSSPERFRHRAHLLVFSVLLLITLGVIMLFSTAAFSAEVRADDLYFDAKRQLFWLAIGIALAVGFFLFDYRKLQPFRWQIYGFVIVLLGACFIPHIGQEINGERRWISGGLLGIPLRIQPSEFAKLGLLIALAAWFDHHRNTIRDTWTGITVPCLLASVILGLIAAEVDIGTTAVLSCGTFAVIYIAGSNRKFLFAGALTGIAALATLVTVVPGRMNRVLALLYPDDYEKGIGHQQAMAKLALGSGGVDGMGLGEGRLKMLYMPFAHTDFIFPMIGEELGLIGTLTVLFCFLSFVLAGLAIAGRAPDLFGQLLGSGLVIAIATQAVLNMAVTTAVFPNTGLPLPFVSYGGSNLVCSLISVGILLSIHRHANRTRGEEDFLEGTREVTARV